ncbi:HET domain protein [Nemania abortiva]|nr:HET domain protein [Nemania abortiva]
MEELRNDSETRGEERDSDSRDAGQQDHAKFLAEAIMTPHPAPEPSPDTTSIIENRVMKAERTKQHALSMPPTYHALPTYCFQPLPIGCIRLLQLRPHRDECAQLQFHLVDHPLLGPGSREGPHFYEALSYVWGSTKKTRIIYTETGCLAITENLHAALLHLRDRTVPRTLWADGICINQDDDEERSCQIKLMAMIYVKATRVIVWLEEAPPCSYREFTTPGDEALEVIRAAAESRSSNVEINKTSEDAVLKLLQRSWFRRIWVLQEISAARQTLIMTYYGEIDGYAFFLGLDRLNLTFEDSDVQSLVRSVTYLLEGSIFRPRYFTTHMNNFSLNISPLGQLIDMHQAREATDRRDKAYALLGMSSDNHKPDGLSANYEISWRELFHQLIEFIIGKEAFIETWDNNEIAVVRTIGYIIGRVNSVPSNGTWKQRQTHHIEAGELLGPMIHCHSLDWIFQTTAKPILAGDIVCVLHGTSKFTIIRAYEDYCAIVAIGVTAVEGDEVTTNNVLELSHSLPAFPSHLPLIWDWEKPWEMPKDGENYESYLRSRALESTDVELEHILDKAARLHIIGQILVETKYFGAREPLRKAIALYARASGIQLPQALLDHPRSEKPARLMFIAAILSPKRYGLSINAENDMLRIAMKFDVELMKFLLDQKGHELQITERDLQEAAKNPWHAEELLKLLLGQQADKSMITESLLVAATENIALVKELLIFLLSQQADKSIITENVLMAAMSNQYDPREFLVFLLGQQADKSIITENVLQAAIKWGRVAEEILALLFSQQTDPNIITEKVLQDVIRDPRYAKDLLALLLSQQVDPSVITEAVLQAAAEHGHHPKELVILLLSQQVNPSIITESVLIKAVINKKAAKDTTALLLSQQVDKSIMTERVLLEAARLDQTGIIKVLIDQHINKAFITEDVLLAAAALGNILVLEMLLDYGGDEVTVTPAVDEFRRVWGLERVDALTIIYDGTQAT